jgi:hypothetical protein
MTENRRFQRIHFDGMVDFEINQTHQDCRLLDISLKGALLDQCGDVLSEPGGACCLTLTLDESTGARIIMNGIIAHKLENRIGVHCQSIDLDSMTHLRKLVELNLGDEALLHRELEALFPADDKEI